MLHVVGEDLSQQQKQKHKLLQHNFNYQQRQQKMNKYLQPQLHKQIKSIPNTQTSFFYSIFMIACLFIYIPNCVEANTLISTQIDGSLTLDLANSPYIANEDIIIGKKGILHIEPGCEIRFAKGKQLIVHGTLNATGTELKRIKFTKLNDQRNRYSYTQERRLFASPDFRLVEGETVLDGKLQVFYNSKWHYICSTQFNWTETDVNVTCQSLGFSNGTFYYYSTANNLTSHMKLFMPRCSGNENNLFECPGSIDPELGLTVCDNRNVVGLVCEGFNDKIVQNYDNWGGIVFQKYAPYMQELPFTSVFFNVSKSVLEYVDVRYAGLIDNLNWLKPNYTYLSTSAVTVFQYAPRFKNITIEYSAGNGLNYSNIEAPALITNSIFRYNRGHGVNVKTRFGNVTVYNTISHDNMGDGFKYYFNNSAWSLREQEEYFVTRYAEYCDSQNPLSYPAYYRFKNPSYVTECSKVNYF
jgi:hypothetical protein